MTIRELTRFALGGLWRQKVRTCLTLIGVTVGTAALAFSLSLGLGLRAFIDTEFQGRDEFWRVTVHVDEPPPDAKDAPADKVAVRGNVAPERAERIREALVERYVSTRPRRAPIPLTPEKLAVIAQLPDVAEVRTFRNLEGRLTTASSENAAPVDAIAGTLADLQPRLIAGRLPKDSAAEIVLTELVLYDLGMGDDADLERALGLSVNLRVGGVRQSQPLALARALTGRRPTDITAAQTTVLGKVVQQLPDKLDAFDLTEAERAVLKHLLDAKPSAEDERPRDSGITVHEDYRVVGVVRLMMREERKKAGPLMAWELTQGDVYLTPPVGAELFGRLPWEKDGSVFMADVRVRPGGDLPGIAASIEAMGYRTISGAKWFASAKREVTLIAAGLNLFAFIALFVAGIGITNTLVTSVVERTKEIGILRAVGATRRQILGLFLAEGAFIGIVGSVVGLALAGGLAIPADAWVQGILRQQMEEEKFLSTTIFSFPWWLWIGSVLFAVGVTTVAAFYPARRAAKIHPIEALRYG